MENTWKNVLYNHVATMFGGDISDMRAAAQRLGCLFFCWNDRVYRTDDGSDTGMTCYDLVN